jgi:hypothetical protein
VGIGGATEEGTVQGCIEVHVIESVIDDLEADGDVYCGAVSGDVEASRTVTCGNVGGDVNTGANVICAAWS